MSATTKLKWRKLTGKLRHLYDELEIVQDMSTAAGGDFQQYYEEFCTKNDIDLAELNSQHAERIKKLYPEESKEENQQEYTGSTAITVAETEEEPEAATPKTEASVIDPEFTHTDDREMHEIFSKLFKKLATVLHPDKLANSDYTEEQKTEFESMFTSAKTALEEKRYFILIDYAERLNVPTPRNYKQQMKWMKKELETVRGSIAKVTRTYNYSFAEAEDDEQRDKLIKKFMQQVFGYDPTNKQ